MKCSYEVIADKGFLIQDELSGVGATLTKPEFLKGKQQFSKEEVEKNKKVATTSCKIVETLSLKNTFSSFQCPPYLGFKPFQLPLPSPPFNVDCLSSQHFFVLLATLIRGGGGLQCER